MAGNSEPKADDGNVFVFGEASSEYRDTNFNLIKLVVGSIDRRGIFANKADKGI